MAAQLPMSLLVRNGGSHKLFYCGILSSSIVSVLTPILAIKCNWIAVLICRVLVGIGQGCLTPCLAMLLAQWVPPMERASLGRFNIFSYLQIIGKSKHIIKCFFFILYRFFCIERTTNRERSVPGTFWNTCQYKFGLAQYFLYFWFSWNSVVYRVLLAGSRFTKHA